MPTFRRGRSNISELNLTSSFMAGGSVYQHHSGSLIAFYRFEEPYDVSNPSDLSFSHKSRVEDSSGHDYYGVITSGSLHADPDDALIYGNPVPVRTAVSSPYRFTGRQKSSTVLGGPSTLLTAGNDETNQVRVINFSSGSSERIELPRQLARDLSSIPSRPFPHREAYEAGMTFAGWVRMHPTTGSFTIDTQTKSDGEMYFRGDYASYLNGETIILEDTLGNVVEFSYSSTSAATIRNGPNDYQIGIGGYGSSLTETEHAQAVQGAIELARSNGDIDIKATLDGSTSNIPWIWHHHYWAYTGGGALTTNRAVAVLTVTNTPVVDSTIQLEDLYGHIERYKAVSGTPSAGVTPVQYDNSGSTTLIATNLAAAINSGHGGRLVAVASSNVVTITNQYAGSFGNTTVVSTTTPATNITVAGGGLEASSWPDSTGKGAGVIQTANKFTGGYDRGGLANYSLGKVSLKQGTGGIKGNTLVRGSTFVESPNGAWDIDGVANHSVSKAVITVGAMPANGETLAVATKDLFGDDLTFTITFTNSGGTATTWSGSKSYAGTSAFTAVIDITDDTTVAAVADAIKTLFDSPTQLPYHDASLATSTVTIVATYIWNNFDLTVTDGTSGDVSSAVTVASLSGSFSGGLGGATSEKSIVDNKFIAKSIFTAITGAYTDPPTSGGNAVNVIGSDATGLSLRVITKPGTDKHNTLSWVASHYSGSSSTSEMSEWRTSKPISTNAWTHVAVVYPTGSNLNEFGLHSSVLKDESSPIEPKIYVNGVRQDTTKIPQSAAATSLIEFKQVPDSGYSIEIIAQASGSQTSARFEFDTTTSFSPAKKWHHSIGNTVPAAEIKIGAAALSGTTTGLANHLATWNVSVPGSDAVAKFILDMHHTGSQAKDGAVGFSSNVLNTRIVSQIFEGGTTKLQKVNPLFSALPKIHIRYGGLFDSPTEGSSYTGRNPDQNDFIQITTPSLNSKVYRFRTNEPAYDSPDTFNTTNAQSVTDASDHVMHALHSSGSLSHHFRVGNQTVVGKVLTTQPAYNYATETPATQGIATTLADHRTAAGTVAARAALASVPADTPILVFSPDDTNAPSAEDYDSERYIICNERFTSDCFVEFKAWPGHGNGNAISTIHANMREKPDGGEGIHVQVSTDGINWYGPYEKVISGSVSALSTTSIDGLPGDYAIATGLKKLYISGSSQLNVVYSNNNTFTDSETHREQEWRHVKIRCRAAEITGSNGLHNPGAEGTAANTNGYYVRIIQKGYSGGNYDPWALCDVTFTGQTHNVFASQRVTNVSIHDTDIDQTWKNFCATITGSHGHDGEIEATQDTTNNVVTLTFKSPVGRISSGVTAGLALTGTTPASENRPVATPTNAKALIYGFGYHQSVRIENFDTSGDAVSTHYRIGLKAAGRSGQSWPGRAEYNAVVADCLSLFDSEVASSAFAVTTVGNDGAEPITITARQRGQTTTLVAPTQNSYFGSGSYPGGAFAGNDVESWQMGAFTAGNGLTVPINDIYASASTTASKLKTVAARLATVVNTLVTSGALGVEAVASSSLDSTVRFAQLVQGPTNESCTIKALDSLSSELGLTRWVNVNNGSAVSHTATAVLTFTNFPGANETITIISHNGSTATSKTYTSHATTDTFASNVFFKGSSASTAATNLSGAIAHANGHGAALVVTQDAGVLTIRQKVPGSTGNTTVTEALANFTSTSFTGGGSVYAASGSFSGGQRTFQSPRGALVPLDAIYLGTPPQLTHLFAQKTHPYGFDFPAQSSLTNYVHELAGRTPKAMIDDIAFWRRCLSDEEINALYSAKDGTLTPKSGFMSHPPRVMVRENDSQNHQYPTISRFGDKDFSGRYNLFYDSSNEQVYHDPFAKAEILFKGRPRDGTWIQLTDWAGRTKQFEFNYGRIVRAGRIEVAIHNDRKPAEVVKTLIAVINGLSGFGIHADVGSRKEAILIKQTKAGTEGNTSILNSSRHRDPQDPGRGILRKRLRAKIPGKFSGGTTSPKVVFPYRLEPGHPTIRQSQPTPNAVSDLLVSGSSHRNTLTAPLAHTWLEEHISPFDESYAFAAFGSEAHSESDDFFTVDTELDQEFYSTGTQPTLVGHGLHGPLWSKRKIEINLSPKENTTLHAHVTTGSTMAYFNFDKKVWEPIGFPASGSYWLPQRPAVSQGYPLTGGMDSTWSFLSSTLPQASIYSVSASSIDGEPASYSGFRQWLDKTYIGFSPSFGMLVANSVSNIANAQAPNSKNQKKYVFCDGGISTPVSTFGFPFHAKYHATSSQYLNTSDYIDRPFLLEKIVYEFKASVHQSASIDVRTGNIDSASTGSYGKPGLWGQHAYINAPTPTFFMLNQRTAALPDVISNQVDVVTVVDGDNRQQNFHYTASLPSRFYLAPPAAEDAPEYVNTIRDLVTFGRYGVFSSGYSENDFESYVPDPRERLDTVIVPAASVSQPWLNDSVLTGTRLTLAFPARSPKVNPAITTFKSEGDFFGNVPATCVVSIGGTVLHGDQMTLTDASGDSVVFYFNKPGTATTSTSYDTGNSRWSIGVDDVDTDDERKIATARLYEAIARAVGGAAGAASGNFAAGLNLHSTGSTNQTSFTVEQKVGGTPGNRSVAIGAAGSVDAARFTSTNFSGGSNVNDDIVLGWEGGRSGTGIMSGRSPFGGEYGAFELAYSVNNNTQTYTLSQSAEDSLVSPYLLMPGDKLIFGWQTPIGTGSIVHHSIAENDGTFEIIKGIGKIVLYGSVLSDDRENHRNTSNQPLTSNFIHEALHFGADVYDQYDTDPPMFHSGTYLDNHVSGSMLKGISKDVFGTTAHILSHRQVVSRRTTGDHSVGPKTGQSNIYQKRSGFLRGVRATDSRERWYDSMLPDIAGLIKADGKRLFSPSFVSDSTTSPPTLASAKGAALILGHPKVATGSNTLGPNDCVWSSWFGAFPFEPRYTGVTRTAGLKTKDVFLSSASGSLATGTRQLQHVWLSNVTGSITLPSTDAGGSNAPGDGNNQMQTISTDMLNIIDHPLLLSDAHNQVTVFGSRNPAYSTFAIVTNEHGHGHEGTTLSALVLDGNNSVFGSYFETNANFFAKVLFGSGDGSYKFPKLPYWKPVGIQSPGWAATDTFVTTKGVILRGFRYGLANVLPKFSSAVFRRDSFGHIRDMLEQRSYTRFFTEDGLEEGPVQVSFVERGSKSSTDPAATNSANLDIFCSSSMPYRDGHALDRISQQPDTAEKVSIAIDIGLD